MWFNHEIMELKEKLIRKPQRIVPGATTLKLVNMGINLFKIHNLLLSVQLQKEPSKVVAPNQE